MRIQEHSQANINQQNKIKQTLINKDNNFSCAQKLLRGWMLFVLRFVFFVRPKYFRKKITNKQACNYLDNLFSLYYSDLSLLFKKALYEVIASDLQLSFTIFQ